MTYTLVHVDWQNRTDTREFATLDELRDFGPRQLDKYRIDALIRTGSTHRDDDAYELAGPGIPKPVRYGDRKESYWMDPRTLSGGEVNHGWSYANADTLEDALKWADQVLNSPGSTYGYVDVSGNIVEFRGDGWHQIRGIYSTRFARTTPVTLSDRDLAMECRFFDAADQFVHELRSDGSCACGHNPSRFAVKVGA